MAKSQFVRARVDENLKASVEELLRPNDDTLRALEEARDGVGVISYDSVEDMFRSWDE